MINMNEINGTVISWEQLSEIEESCKYEVEFCGMSGIDPDLCWYVIKEVETGYNISVYIKRGE